jgi:SAM-dependent methyltransferase
MTIRIYRNRRLAYYGQAGDTANFWSDHWDNIDWRAWLDGAKGGGLGYFEEPFLEYLPKEGRILEAGCGVGHLVVALRTRGYDIEGVEFSEKTVSMVKGYLEDCPIKVGDVTELDYPNGFFSSYVSIGVMEHYEGGPEPILKEAHRVLKSGGYMLVSVPRLHPIRRLKGMLGLYGKKASGHFYQYAFGDGEFADLITANGFASVDRYYYDPIKGIKDELGLFNYFYKKKQIPQRILNRIGKSPFFNRLASHMVLFIARKISAD